MSTPAEGQRTTLQALSDELADAVAAVAPSVVAIHARRRIPASGVHWRRGVVVATHHTIRRDQGIRVSIEGGGTITAELAGRDPTTDLAVFRVEGSDLQAAPVADPGGLRAGNLVLALGRPGAHVTASLGAVSAAGGEWRTWGGGRIDRFIKLDLTIYDGFSGGPLVDAGGRVLGINTSGLARGLPVTIPVATVDRVIDQLLDRGYVRRGYLGLGMQPVRLETVPSGVELKRPVGLMIVKVDPDGPADRAGLLLGDILLSFGGTPVADPTEVLGLLTEDRIGSEVTVRLLRAGAVQEVQLRIGERQSREE